jgi:hypothetical protein
MGEKNNFKKITPPPILGLNPQTSKVVIEKLTIDPISFHLNTIPVI